MKLYLLRHGEAENPTSFKNDFDRCLNETGRNQIKNVSTLFSLPPTDQPIVAYCSAAKRTKETFEIISTSLKVLNCFYVKELYHASRKFLIEFLRNISSEKYAVLIVGHNNGISELATYLVDEEIVFPTGGLLIVNFPVIEDWKYIGVGTGAVEMKFF